LETEPRDCVAQRLAGGLKLRLAALDVDLDRALADLQVERQVRERLRRLVV
jgi:hypothetical protein